MPNKTRERVNEDEPGTVAIRDSGPLELSRRATELLADIPEADEEEMMYAMMDRIVNAASLEEIASLYNKLPGLEQVASIPLQIMDITKHDSDIADAPMAIYLVVNAIRREDRTPLMFSTGSPGIVLTLARLRELGELPIGVTIVPVQTRSGRTTYNLRID